MLKSMQKGSFNPLTIQAPSEQSILAPCRQAFSRTIAYQGLFQDFARGGAIVQCQNLKGKKQVIVCEFYDVIIS